MKIIVVLVVVFAFIIGPAVVGVAQQAPDPTTSPTATITPTRSPTVTQTATLRATATQIQSITPQPTNTATRTPMGPPPYKDWAVENYAPPWSINCDDEPITNGYRLGQWARGFCVPGLITRASQFFRQPSNHHGLMSSYADGVMENQVAYRGYDRETVSGVALMSCDYIHSDVWLRIPGVNDWKKFKVVDCSQRNHMYYHLVGMGLVAEISYKDAIGWGKGNRIAQRVDVQIGGGRPGPGWVGYYLPFFWVENVLEWTDSPDGGN